MLKVYICEDVKSQRDQFLKIIQDTIEVEKLDIKIEMSSDDPQDVLEHVKNVKETGIYFLDIDLKNKINGIFLAKEIRKYDPQGFIVFVTTHAEMTLLTFEYNIEAMDYIIKDTMKNVQEKIHKCILNAYEKHLNSNILKKKIFKLKLEEKVMNIECSEILFFETSNAMHKINLHLFNRILEFYAKMKDIQKELDKSFYRCHNSYIVNVENISAIDIREKIAIMKNGSECIISRRLLKGLLKAYENINIMK